MVLCLTARTVGQDASTNCCCPRRGRGQSRARVALMSIQLTLVESPLKSHRERRAASLLLVKSEVRQRMSHKFQANNAQRVAKKGTDRPNRLLMKGTRRRERRRRRRRRRRRLTGMKSGSGSASGQIFIEASVLVNCQFAECAAAYIQRTRADPKSK